MSGADGRRTADIIRGLTTVGTLLFVGWTLWLFQVIYRVTQVGGSQLAGVWEERIETLSFITFPNQIAALGMPAAAAAAATWLAGPTQELGLAILLRLIRWTCNAVVVVATLSVVTAIFGRSGGIDDVETIAFRGGGAVTAAGYSYLCLAAGRSAPGG